MSSYERCLSHRSIPQHTQQACQDDLFPLALYSFALAELDLGSSAARWWEVEREEARGEVDRKPRSVEGDQHVERWVGE